MSGPKLSTQSMKSKKVQSPHLSLCDRLSELEGNLENHSPPSPSWIVGETAPQKVFDQGQLETKLRAKLDQVRISPVE